MNLSDLGVDGGQRRTLVILGAGASRGASFVDENSPQTKPPLDRDFFQQVSRMDGNDELKGKIERLLRFARQEFETEIGLSMENFLSEIDYTDRFHQDFNVDPGPIVKRYQKALSDFHSVLPRLLNQTCSKECDYHNQIAKSLRTKDCVISYNYDCIIDRALKNNTLKRWDPDKGSYGFDISGSSNSWKDHSDGRKVDNTIRLLKLHGSMNWDKNGNEIELIDDTNDVQDLTGSIIPPTGFKNLEKHPFKEIWKRARKEVRRARIIIVVGYSVPETDLFSKSLLKVEAGSKEKRERLDLLVLVNPDVESRESFVNTIQGGLEDQTRILEYDNIKQFYKLLENNS